MSYTPGPWRYVRPVMHRPYAYIEAECDGRNVAELNDNRNEYEANGRLIAAAPDLLAAVKALLDPDTEGDVEQAIRAIGKAEGTEAYAEHAAHIIAKEGREP